MREKHRLGIPIAKNGVLPPRKGTIAAEVWKIADDLTYEQGFTAYRIDVEVVARDRGIGLNLILRQYQMWKQYHGIEYHYKTRLRNGVPPPEPGTDNEIVWSIATSMSKKLGYPAFQPDVVKIAVEEHGIEHRYASDCFQLWAAYHGANRNSAAKRRVDNVPVRHDK